MSEVYEAYAHSEDRERARTESVFYTPRHIADFVVKKSWARDSRGIVKERLGKDRAATFLFPDGNPDLPFVYRAMEWAKPGGQIALITHARWLFSQTPKVVNARRDLLESLHVTGALNGASLRDSNVWPKVRHPFCLLFAKNELPPTASAFQFVSPRLDIFPDSQQDRLRIDWADARDVVVSEVLSESWMLKVRYRGGNIDESVVRTLMSRGPSLKTYLARLGTGLRNGYQTGGQAGTQTSAKHLAGLHDLRGTKQPHFVVDADSLLLMTRPTLLFPRRRETYLGPLLLIHESVRANRLAPRAILSISDLAFDERFDGASFKNVPNGAQIAEYLQLVIQSSLWTYAFLMVDGQFGVEREVVHLSTINAIPIIPFDQVPATLRDRCRRLSRALSRAGQAMPPELLAEIDSLVGDVYGLDDVERDAIDDALATGLPTAQSKARAVAPTSREERKAFAELCRSELDEILAASEASAEVRISEDLAQGPWRFIQLDRLAHGESPPKPVRLPVDRFLVAADEGAASLVTIWLNRRSSLVGILDQYQYWTKTRARSLAMSFLVTGEARPE